MSQEIREEMLQTAQEIYDKLKGKTDE